jgi:hypothetical protein
MAHRLAPGEGSEQRCDCTEHGEEPSPTSRGRRRGLRCHLGRPCHGDRVHQATIAVAGPQLPAASWVRNQTVLPVNADWLFER